MAAASRQRLAVGLLGALVWLLPLLLGLEPAVALDRVAAGSVAARLMGPSLSPAIASVTPRLVGPTVLSSDRLAPPSDSAASVPELFQQALEASRSGRFGEALPLWNRVLELAPEDAAAWSNRGNVRLALGDAEAAIRDQERSMQLDSANPDPHLNRGTAEEALGRWDAAAADYAWILERNPLDASALYNLGNVQGSRGDWQAARDRFVAAADARPGFAMA
ncbi:MAG: tetratricopeptide repeat protein, partial [Cyanobium sp.]